MTTTRSGVAAYTRPATGIPMADLATPLGWGELVTGNYYFTASPSAVSTSATLGNGSLRLAPWVVPNAVTVVRVGTDIATAGEAGSKFRIGIYADNGGGYPGALVVDAGQINGDSNTAQELTVSTALTAGLYWIGGAVQSAPTTQPAVRIASSNVALIAVTTGTSMPAAAAATSGFLQTSVSGALPDPFTATPAAANLVPRIFVKV